MYFNYNNYEYKMKLRLKSQKISSCIVIENPFFVKSLEDWERMNIIDVTIEVKNQFCLIERFDNSTEINPPTPKKSNFSCILIRQVSCNSEEVPSESWDGRTRPTQGRGRNHPRVFVPERSHTLYSHREEGFLPLWIKW